MIVVENRVPIYEVGGERVEGPQAPLEVSSHWNDDAWVSLTFGGKKITVNAKDLLAAVDNATNTHRF